MSRYRSKPGKHGTLWLYRITYRDDSPGSPTFSGAWWAYDEAHALERFHDSDDGDTGWKIVSGPSRVPEIRGGKARHAMRGSKSLHKRISHDAAWTLSSARRVVWLGADDEGMRSLSLADQKAALVRGVEDGDLYVSAGRRKHGANWLQTLEFRDRDGNPAAYAELRVVGGKRRHAPAKRRASSPSDPSKPRTANPGRLAAALASLNRVMRG